MVEAAGSFRLACRGPDDELFRFGDKTVTTQMFLSMASLLADELPVGRHMLNLCQDRLQFAVALAAGLLHDQISLLTDDRAPERLRALEERFAGLYSLSDHPGQASPLRHHLVRPLPPWSHLRGHENP